MTAAALPHVEPILREICNEPCDRLLAFIKGSYGVSQVEGRTVLVTGSEYSEVSQRSGVHCLIVASPGGGQFVGLRNRVDGTLSLPSFFIPLVKGWRSPHWFLLLRQLAKTFRELTGCELLVPEPVAQSKIWYVHADDRHPVDALIFAGQTSGTPQAGQEWTSCLVNDPAELHDYYRQCAQLALPRLKSMLPFPSDEQHSLLAPSRISQAIRNSARRLLRLTPQPHKKWLRHRVIDLLKPGNSAIDLAAGDDTFMFEVASEKPNSRIFINDVVREGIERMVGRAIENDVVILNHDIRSFPPLVFDLAILKNCLHHLRRIGDQLAFFEALPGIAKAVLVVEIENPRHSPLHQFIHKRVYTDDPATDGDVFYTFDQFRMILAEILAPQCSSLAIGKVWTVRGTYLLAELHFQSEDPSSGGFKWNT